jgi:hypothetical protein
MSADEGLQIGRRKKAKRIAAALRNLGATADHARQLSDGEWVMAADLAIADPKRRMHKQPSAETRSLVIAELESDPKDEDVPA